ncbi:hypothetical protein FACS1894172_08770 [Spirochaetia bacterium]|nr:hypothetical protein FACS1894164_12310 [Spirochaetia bacterium]GHU32337.1 hypothetical protein FACS1894172_08770 [Spirochaetia bacterium]
MKSHYPVAVIPLEYYKLLITFDNDENRIFDVSPYLEDTYFAPIKNLAVFRSVKINPITIEWLNEIDICPDELYYNSVLAENY